tara:strand:- start:978 stop:2012 length:1035 start_codon:yes stop_codon:yes gene_type:complete
MRLVRLTQDDILIDTQKVTTGYFSGGLGTILGSSLTTASLSATQLKYYVNLQYSSADHFSITYGNIDGSGSSAASLNAGVGETEAVYKSYASYLLRTDEVRDGFKITNTTTADKDVFFVLAERARMKDRLNPGTWTLALSGSTTAGAAASLTLTDDSKTNLAAATPIGPRFNVYAGTAGTVSSTTTKYGYFWPDAGCIALTATALSASIPGKPGYITHTGFGSSSLGIGLAVNSANSANNYYKLASAMNFSTANQQFRSEEDQTTVTYFCRALSRDFNASSNATFTSGSEGEYQQSSFEGNPQTFITTVGLYNAGRECVAVGRLSKAILKNYSVEAIIKTTLTY